MAVYLSNGVVLTVNAVDLSSLTSSVTINRNVDELETTSMGQSGHTYVAGLEASSITIEFFNDDQASKTLQTLNSTTVFGKNITVTAQQTSAATSAANPLYTMTCLVNGVTPINGGVQDLSTQSVTWNVSGTVAIATT